MTGTVLLAAAAILAQAAPTPPELPLGTWVKLSPIGPASQEGTSTPPSPTLGYEGACVWDGKHRVLVRYGGHNQGGGGEQGSEVWTFDPWTKRWTLKEPNVSPPGVCCNQQNVFDPSSGLYIRFPSFSGNHGWQWRREIGLNDSSVWVYDLATNQWRNRNPFPTPSPKGLRCASWDSHARVVVLFGGETSNEGTLTYDPWTNEWRRMRPPVEPEARSGGNMAYDAARRLHVLFGVQFGDDPHTWGYDLAKNEWRDLKPPEMPPTRENDCVLAYDPVRERIAAIVKITEGKDDDARHRLETWTYDGGTNRWAPLEPPREPDPSGSRARVLVFAPEMDAFLLENCTHPPQAPREQQVWALRLGPGLPRVGTSPEGTATLARGPARPRIVEDVVVSVLSAVRVQVSWKSSDEPDIVGYAIERAPVEVASEDQLRSLKKRTPPLSPPSVGLVRKVGRFERLSPALLAGSSVVDTRVELRSPAEVDGEPVYERRIHEEEFDPAGKPYPRAVYAYRVRAVDRAGLESGPSAAVFTIPSMPRDLFSREDGTTCHLKWAPNPEKGIVGYRVYRLSGRYDDEPLERLTPEPLTVMEYADAGAGEDTRRYHVVAVDALGQEGQPSAPVWFAREWKAYYEPFAKDWHQ